MLTRLRNAIKVGKTEVVLPYSNVKFIISNILKKEGYVSSVEKRKSALTSFDEIAIGVKYNSAKNGAIRHLRRISTPGRRLYIGHRDINDSVERRGVTLLSTPKGIMTHKDALKEKVGGEIICEIY